MITYLVPRIAAKLHAATVTPARFVELVGQSLFERKDITHIGKPPGRPQRPKYANANQLQFVYR